MVGQCIAQTQQTQITAVSLDRSELINLILQVPLCGDKASRSAVTCRAGRRASQTAIVHKINIFITNSNMIIKYFKPRVEPTCTSISVGEPTVFRSFCTPPFEFFNRGVVVPNGTTTLKLWTHKSCRWMSCTDLCCKFSSYLVQANDSFSHPWRMVRIALWIRQ